MEHKIKTIVFDLDGTLVNSLGTSLLLIQSSFLEVCGQNISKDQISSHFGQPEERIFEALLPKKMADKVLDHYVKSFANQIGTVSMFHGILDGLSQLQKNNFKLGLYTARGSQTTEIILEGFKLKPFFEAIVTGTDVSNGKPHIEGLVEVKRQLADSITTPRETAYIGDSPKDMLMAKEYGAKALGVSWCGYCDRQGLHDTGPDQVFSEPSELFDFLVSLK